MCSPWARNLRTELHAVLGENENTQSNTRKVLKKQLLLVGRRLVEVVRVWMNGMKQANIITTVGGWVGRRRAEGKGRGNGECVL
jgi:hypothetical protein